MNQSQMTLSSPLIRSNKVMPPQHVHDETPLFNQNHKNLLRYISIVCVFSLSFGSHYSAHNLGALKSQIKENLKISNQQYGTLQSSVGVVNTVIPIFAGVVTDLFGNYYGAFGATSLIVLGSFMISVSAHTSSFFLMTVGRIIYGIGSGTILLIQEMIFAKWRKKKELGRWLGFLFSVGKLGGFLSTVLSPIIASAFEFYGYALWVSTILCLLSWLFCITYILISLKLDKDQGPESLPSSVPSIRRFNIEDMKHLPWLFWLFILCPYLLSGGWTAFLHVDVELIKTKFDKSNKESAFYASIVQFGVCLLYPLFGFMTDKFERKPLFMFFSSLLFVASVSVLGFTKIHPIIPLLLFTVSLGIGPIMLVSCIPLFVPEEILGTALGLYNSAINVGNVIQDVVIGKLQDVGKSYHGPMLFLIAVGSAAIIVIGAIMICDRAFMENKLSKKARADTKDEDQREASYSHTYVNYIGFSFMLLMMVSSWLLYAFGFK